MQETQSFHDGEELIEKFKPEPLFKAENSQKRSFEQISKDIMDLLVIRKDRRLATQELADEFIKRYHPWCMRNEKKPTLFVYENGIYVPDGEPILDQFIQQIVSEQLTEQLKNEVALKVKTKRYINSKEFYEKEPREKIAVKNGILDVCTKELTSFKPFTIEDWRNDEGFIFFNKLPVNYDPSAKSTKAIEFIESLFPENDPRVQLLKEITGYVLYKDYSIEKFWVFLGKGRNGKSQFLQMIRSLVGTENVSSLSLQKITEPNSFDRVSLWRKLVNLGGDISSRPIYDSDTLKGLTGNDEIETSRKHNSTLKFKNYAKLIFACNKLPIIIDKTNGMWDRVAFMTFPFRFEHKTVLDKLPEKEKMWCKERKNNIVESIISDKKEMSGFLNWALEGLNELLKKGHYSDEGTRNVKEEYLLKADSFAAFCKDMLISDYDGMISKDNLRKIYTQYCKFHKLDSVSDKHIKEHLTIDWGVSEKQVTVDKIRVWKGINYSQGSQAEQGVSFSTGIHLHEEKKEKGVIPVKGVNKEGISEEYMSPSSQIIDIFPKNDQILERQKLVDLILENNILESEEKADHYISQMINKGELYEPERNGIAINRG